MSKNKRLRKKTKEFDVGLVTFGHANNFGAILTAYGLYYRLEKLGHKTLMIEKPDFWWPGFTPEKHVLSDQFRKKHVVLSKPYKDKNELEKLNEICSTFVVGSDQMWNHYLYETAGYYTFLDFAKDEAKKIAYAPSFGHDIIFAPKEEWVNIKCYLNRFNAISVREASGVKLLKDKFNIKAVNNLDPVFLCPRRQYEKLGNSCDTVLPQKYIFAYILDINDDKIKTLKQLSDRLGIPYVCVTDAGQPIDRLPQYDLDLTEMSSVEEWLKYVMNSEFVLTDSFHGTCFAIIFNKQFISIRNSGRGGTRFDSILGALSLENRLVTDTMPFEDYWSNLGVVNYKKINILKWILIKRSRDWLKRALKLPEEKLSKSLFYSYILHQKEEDSFERKTYNLNDLGLPIPCTIKDIVLKLPNSSTFIQAQGAVGKPILDTPIPYGVLRIVKTSNYFVEITFTQMTIKGKSPKLFQANWIDGDVKSWTRFVADFEIEALEERLSQLEDKICKE